jgi:hypothetical protein
VPHGGDRATDVDPAHDHATKGGPDRVGVLWQNELSHLGKRVGGGLWVHGRSIGRLDRSSQARPAAELYAFAKEEDAQADDEMIWIGEIHLDIEVPIASP